MIPWCKNVSPDHCSLPCGNLSSLTLMIPLPLMTLANFSSGAFLLFPLSAGGKRGKLLSLDFSADVEDFTAKFSDTGFVFSVFREKRENEVDRSFLFDF